MADTDSTTKAKPQQSGSGNTSSKPSGGTARKTASGRPSRPMTGTRAARRAALHLMELTGKDFEGIVGIKKVEDGWTVEVEVLEMRRVPSTTDVLAVYEVSVDGSGELVGYERVARYVRGDAGKDRG